MTTTIKKVLMFVWEGVPKRGDGVISKRKVEVAVGSPSQL
jgi:hypothetical protein